VRHLGFGYGQDLMIGKGLPQARVDALILGGYALDELGLGQFKELNGLRSSNGGKIPQKAVGGIALFDVVQQGLNGDARAGETGRAVHYVRGHGNHSGKAGFLFSGHNLKIGQIGDPRTDEPRRAVAKK
jgi:hypothetical protein